MQRTMCKSKIHRATVTETNLNYVGSVTIDAALMEAADILPYERVQVVNVNNGERLETYAIPGEAGGGQICLNGAGARLAQPGDLVIIISYGIFSDAEARDLRPAVLFVDGQNRLVRRVQGEAAGPVPAF